MPTVLCIDDDSKTLEVQKAILERNGYTVLLAADGPTGISLAAEQPIDLVILDFKMPGMDGGEVAEILLQDQPALPIVIRSGFLDSVPEWLRWCAIANLEKGESPDVLLTAIEGVIGKNKKQSQPAEPAPINPKRRVA
jgi:DNA-binding NtrC family response regulator